MKHIGHTIKELRKKNDLTQERLADYLGVTYQAVSKWETGMACPDLSLIVPLARLLHVTTDELFGLLPEDVEDPGKKELEAVYEETMKTGDVLKRLEIAKQLTTEYPGDMRYLHYLGEAYYSYGIHHCPRGSEEQMEAFRTGNHYKEMALECCTDNGWRELILHNLVLYMADTGRREEAMELAKQSSHADEILENFLTGEDWERARQRRILDKLFELTTELENGKHDLEGIQAAEKIYQIIISDGNYQWLHDEMMHNYVWQALCYARCCEDDAAACALEKSLEHAIKYEEMLALERDEDFFTAPILRLVSIRRDAIWRSGTSTMVEDVLEYLSWPELVRLQEREDVQQLMARARAYRPRKD